MGAVFNIKLGGGVLLVVGCDSKDVCDLIGCIISKNWVRMGYLLGIKIETEIQGRGNYPDLYKLTVARNERPAISYGLSELEFEQVTSDMLMKLLHSTNLVAAVEGESVRLEWDGDATPTPLSVELSVELADIHE